MGPGVAGLGALRLPAPPPRWRVRLERTWGVSLTPPPSRLEFELARSRDEWETELRRIDFPEVTNEDRATFLEHVVGAQVHRALVAGRFDLALALSTLGSHRVAGLLAPHDERGARPSLHLIHGTERVHEPPREAPRDAGA